MIYTVSGSLTHVLEVIDLGLDLAVVSVRPRRHTLFVTQLFVLRDWN